MSYQAVWLHLGALLLVWGCILTVLVTTAFLLSRLRITKHQLQSDWILLELTPPPQPHSTLQATEEFFRVLSQILNLRPWHDLVRGIRPNIALEVVSTKEQGVRYIVRLPKADHSLFLHNLAAYAPTVTATEIPDYLGAGKTRKRVRLLELKQSGQRAYALRHSLSQADHDPIAYLTNAISQLAYGELVAFQVILSPVSGWHLGINLHTAESAGQPPDLITATDRKSRRSQFYVNLRVYVATNTSVKNQQRVKGIRGALAAFTYDGYQSLIPRLEYPHWLVSYRLFLFRNRLPSIFSRHACLLDNAEVAALYHFPYGTAVHTEDLVTSQVMALPLPLALKNEKHFDVILGENVYHGRTAKIGLTEEERQRHMYVVGGTGNGKSTMLQYAIVQDIRAGKGVAVIDPHGDLAETILQYIPEERMSDVIYFNPADIRFPVGLNLLELSKDLDDDQLLQEKDLLTESIVSMFRKIFSTNDTSGHRIEYVLRNAVQTALCLEKPTLFTVYELLTDSEFRKRTVKQLENEDLKLFWQEFKRAGSYQQVSMAAGITAKIGRFLFSATARRVLEQPQSTINFDELMKSKKILICNFSKGKLGEDTSELFGIMVLAKLQQTTLRRANLQLAGRRPYYVYVDEFQNFATMAFVQLLAEARKYGLFLTMAQQSTAQQADPRITDVILANVGTVVCFRTSSPTDEQRFMPLLAPHVKPDTINQLPAYTFYMRIAAVKPKPPFSGHTVLVSEPADPMLAQLIIHQSRTTYGTEYVLPTKESKLQPKHSRTQTLTKTAAPGSS